MLSCRGAEPRRITAGNLRRAMRAWTPPLLSGALPHAGEPRATTSANPPLVPRNRSKGVGAQADSGSRKRVTAQTKYDRLGTLLGHITLINWAVGT
jgi:hypothetical protein